MLPVGDEGTLPLHTPFTEPLVPAPTPSTAPATTQQLRQPLEALVLTSASLQTVGGLDCKPSSLAVRVTLAPPSLLYRVGWLVSASRDTTYPSPLGVHWILSPVPSYL